MTRSAPKPYARLVAAAARLTKAHQVSQAADLRVKKSKNGSGEAFVSSLANARAAELLALRDLYDAITHPAVLRVAETPAGGLPQ